MATETADIGGFASRYKIKALAYRESEGGGRSLISRGKQRPFKNSQPKRLLQLYWGAKPAPHLYQDFKQSV
ncbi:MAG: hypothetical protein AAB497_02555 [Patescibacteria group bacterium]